MNKRAIVKTIRWAATAVVGTVLLAWAMPERSCGQRVVPVPLGGPCPNECQCLPNIPGFGHVRTQWREWPCEVRPDKAFPASVDREWLRTPPAERPAPQVPVPLPKAEGGQRNGGPFIPEEPKPEKILPEGGPIQAEPNLPKVPIAPDKPAEPPPPTPGPGGTEDGMKGLPPKPPGVTLLEPGPDRRSPGLLSGPGIQGPQPPSRPGKVEVPEPPAAPKRDDQSGKLTQPWSIGRPDRLPAGVPDEKMPHQRIEADWTRALEPGYRGPWAWPRFSGAAAERIPAAAAPAEKVSPATHQATAGRSEPAAVQRSLFERPHGQPAQVAQAAWQADTRPAALDGFCPVELGKNERWIKGDPRWSASHQGMTFWCSGPVQRECLLVEPERYAPAYCGRDVVLLLDENRSTPGRVDYCVSYEGRLYTFSSADTLARFRQDPRRYMLPAPR